MKAGNWILAILLTTSALCFGKATNDWLKSVPQADRNRVNPYAGKPDAVAAGAILFHSNCAQCHGEDAAGKYSRPVCEVKKYKMRPMATLHGC